MAFLTGLQIREEIKNESILIESLDPKYPFRLDDQVTEDSIDLRVATYGMKIKSSISKIDYISDDLKSVYEHVNFSRINGYELSPGEIIYTQTLEAVTFPDHFVGLVVARSTFARLGLMITCGAPKFATGISWCFPLQIKNLNSVPVVIYLCIPAALTPLFRSIDPSVDNSAYLPHLGVLVS